VSVLSDSIFLDVLRFTEYARIDGNWFDCDLVFLSYFCSDFEAKFYRVDMFATNSVSVSVIWTGTSPFTI
jgi:hypothetical protein